MRQIIKKVIREVLNEGVLSFKKRKITKVFHVGEMNIKNKSKFSLEGSGLSVSINPNEWRKIAKLGGKELHILTNPNGIFVDGNKLNKQQKNNVISWGVENGYISQKETYKVCWYDDEMEDDVCMEFKTYDEAKVEAEYGKTIEVNKGGLLPTSKLISTSMQGRIEPSQTFDLLLTIFVEKTTNYDGIWWNDKLDVMKYSAPRGVIFNSKLNNWKIRLPEIAGGFLNEGKLTMLQKTLMKHRDNYGKECSTTPQGLNSGYCEDIAYDVIEELGGETSTTYLIDDGFFWIFHPDEDEEVSDYKTESGEYWNIDNFKKYGEPPFSYDDLDKLDLNGHVWIYSNGKHYDIEAIHGVDNFWDLPLYQRQLSGLNLVEKED